MKVRNTTAKWIESSQRWQINVTNESGERKTFVCSTPGRAGQTECNRKADKWLLATVSGASGRCDRLLDKWLEHVKISTGGSNYRQRKSITETWIRPAIGKKRLSSVSRQDFQGILNKGAAHGLSKKSLENIRGAISNFLAFYDRSERLVVSKSAPQNEKRILQPSGLSTLFNSDLTTYYRKDVRCWYIHAWRFAVVTGLRPGELVALEWRHVDRNTIRVRGSRNYDDEMTRGKNENAIRDEPLTVIAAEILSAQRQMLLQAGIVSKHVFPAADGSQACQQHIAVELHRYLVRNNIPEITPYEMRHTYVSIIAGLGDLSLSELRSVLGHGQNMDTLGVYNHALTDQMQRIKEKTDAAFSSLLHQNEFL